MGKEMLHKHTCDVLKDVAPSCMPDLLPKVAQPAELSCFCRQGYYHLCPDVKVFGIPTEHGVLRNVSLHTLMKAICRVPRSVPVVSTVHGACCSDWQAAYRTTFTYRRMLYVVASFRNIPATFCTGSY